MQDMTEGGGVIQNGQEGSQNDDFTYSAFKLSILTCDKSIMQFVL